ncbi:hypothetical protein HDU92_006129 [Lobulomyces angularis]|nr:hypothetical protein HDU92_006129 [Lobulomyces angularis]
MMEPTESEFETRLLLEKQNHEINQNNFEEVYSTQPKNKTVLQRQEYFDGLRGFAAFQVYAAHELKFSFKNLGNESLFLNLFKDKEVLGELAEPGTNLGYFVGGLIIAELHFVGFFKYVNSRSWWWILHFLSSIIPILALIPGVDLMVENFLNKTIFFNLLIVKYEITKQEFNYKFMCDLYR